MLGRTVNFDPFRRSRPANSRNQAGRRQSDKGKLTASADRFYPEQMKNVLSFKFENKDEETVAIVPCVDGVGLDQLVADFERAAGYSDPAGGYGGLIPSFYRFGPLSSYFLGRKEPVQGGGQGEIYVLSRECGEVGCWPLVAHVIRRLDDPAEHHFRCP